MNRTLSEQQAKQLKDYENAVIAKRLEELDEDEVQALVEEIERDDFWVDKNQYANILSSSTPEDVLKIYLAQCFFHNNCGHKWDSGIGGVVLYASSY